MLFVLLYSSPQYLLAQLALEEQRATPLPQAEAIPPPAPPVPVLDTTARQLRRSTLLAVARGAAEGLLAGSLLLVLRFSLPALLAGTPVLGTWPDLGPEWFGNYVFQAVLLTALARGIARLLGGQPIMPVSGGLLFILLLCLGEGSGWVRPFLWVSLALLGFSEIMLLGRLLRYLRDYPDNAALGWGFINLSRCLTVPFLVPFGFMVGELVAGDVQPTALTAPLHGAIIGWAVGIILGAPWAGQMEAPVPKKDAGQQESEKGSPK
jgi:hypothetical protein